MLSFKFTSIRLLIFSKYVSPGQKGEKKREPEQPIEEGKFHTVQFLFALIFFNLYS